MSKKLQKELCQTIRLLKNVNLVMEYVQRELHKVN